MFRRLFILYFITQYSNREQKCDGIGHRNRILAA